MLCFFKQKTAYEMRISDWSADVCSSDLGDPVGVVDARIGFIDAHGQAFLLGCGTQHEGVAPCEGRNIAVRAPQALIGDEQIGFIMGAEERRVGQACVSPCRSRWSRYP